MNALPTLPLDADDLLRHLDRAGVFASDEDSARTLYHAGPHAGYNVYRIDLGKAHNAEDVHRTFGKALHFPEWFGFNWDALADCLTDMSWNEADGYLVILQSIKALKISDPDALRTLISVLQDASAAWKAQHVPFWVLVIGDIPGLPQVGAPAC